MINQIKDKQTGEYHDIGGLKCKLVAEGTLELDDEEYGYKKFYDFEEGKTYLICILEPSGDSVVSSQGTMKGNVLITPLTHETLGNNFVFLKYNMGDSYISFYDMDYSRFTLSENFSYKIYELPFALEV